MALIRISLSDQDRHYLEKLLSKGDLPVRVYKRGQALLLLDQGQNYKQVASIVGRGSQTVSLWADKYADSGLDFLEDQPRKGRPIRISGEERAKITALACSDPPEGYARWSLRLLAGKAVELGYVEELSHTKAAEILKKTNLSPT